MTKTELESYIPLKRAIESINNQIEEIDTLLYKARSSLLTPSKASKTIQSAQTVDELIIRKETVVKTHREELESFISLEERITAALKSLQPKERLILRLRYIEGMTAEDIIKKTQYQEAHSIYRKTATIITKIKNF